MEVQLVIIEARAGGGMRGRTAHRPADCGVERAGLVVAPWGAPTAAFCSAGGRHPNA